MQVIAGYQEIDVKAWRLELSTCFSLPAAACCRRLRTCCLSLSCLLFHIPLPCCTSINSALNF